MKVDDRAVREAIGENRNSRAQHNGLEDTFALVPQADGGWKRVNLSPTGSITQRTGVTSYENVDTSRAELPLAQVDLNAVAKQGVAFGMTIHGEDGREQVLWLQEPEQNFKPQT